MSTKSQIKQAVMQSKALGHPSNVLPAGLTPTNADKAFLKDIGLVEGTKAFSDALLKRLQGKAARAAEDSREYELTVNQARPVVFEDDGKTVKYKAVPEARFINERGPGIQFRGNGWTKSAALIHLENIEMFRQLVESMPDDEGTNSGV